MYPHTCACTHHHHTLYTYTDAHRRVHTLTPCTHMHAHAHTPIHKCTRTCAQTPHRYTNTRVHADTHHALTHMFIHTCTQHVNALETSRLHTRPCRRAPLLCWGSSDTGPRPALGVSDPRGQVRTEPAPALKPSTWETASPDAGDDQRHTRARPPVPERHPPLLPRGFLASERPPSGE